MTTSHGPMTRSIVMCPGIDDSAANRLPRCSAARSLSRRSIGLSFIAGAGRRALHFAARRPPDPPARRERDIVDVEAEPVGYLPPDRFAQLVTGHGAVGFDDDDHAVGPPGHARTE